MNFIRSIITLVCLVALAACQTQNATTDACSAISVAYSTYTTSGLGSVKDRVNVDAAYAVVQPICASPSTATPAQLATVAVQLALIASTYKKVHN